MSQQLLPAAHSFTREKRRTFTIGMFLIVFVVVCGKAWAVDEFQGIQCGSDIPKSLIGKRFSNERVVVLEERHRDLGLKDLGGSYVSDDEHLFLSSWQICEREYEFLLNLKTNLIRDVLLFPPHSATSPQYVGACQDGGKKVPEVIVAVLDNSAGYDARDQKLSNTMLKATAAWKIDEATAKFIKQPTKNLQCRLGGIITVDGGP